MATNAAARLQEQGGSETLGRRRQTCLTCFTFRTGRRCFDPRSAVHETERRGGNQRDGQGEVRMFRRESASSSFSMEKNVTPRVRRVSSESVLLRGRWFPVLFYLRASVYITPFLPPDVSVPPRDPEPALGHSGKEQH